MKNILSEKIILVLYIAFQGFTCRQEEHSQPNLFSNLWQVAQTDEEAVAWADVVESRSIAGVTLYHGERCVHPAFEYAGHFEDI